MTSITSLPPVHIRYPACSSLQRVSSRLENKKENMKERANQRIENSSIRRRRLHVRGYLLIWVNQQPAACVLQISISPSALHSANSSKPGFLFVNTYKRLFSPFICVQLCMCEKLRKAAQSETTHNRWREVRWEKRRGGEERRRTESWGGEEVGCWNYVMVCTEHLNICKQEIKFWEAQHASLPRLAVKYYCLKMWLCISN